MRAPFLLASTLLLSALLAAAARAPRVPDTPRFSGDTLPVPPQQHADWAAATGVVPEAWNDAARTLFEQGLADPRGCEYREIGVVAGSVSGGAFVVQTHGWVLPRVPPRQDDFAVCWNGLVYPVVKVGAPVDFRADARDGVNPPAPAERTQRGEGARLSGWREGRVVAGSPNLPLKACLLLRLGEPALAREVTLHAIEEENESWARARGKVEASAIDETADPYLDFHARHRGQRRPRRAGGILRVAGEREEHTGERTFSPEPLDELGSARADAAL